MAEALMIHAEHQVCQTMWLRQQEDYTTMHITFARLLGLGSIESFMPGIFEKKPGPNMSKLSVNRYFKLPFATWHVYLPFAHVGLQLPVQMAVDPKWSTDLKKMNETLGDPSLVGSHDWRVIYVYVYFYLESIEVIKWHVISFSSWWCRGRH